MRYAFKVLNRGALNGAPRRIVIERDSTTAYLDCPGRRPITISWAEKVTDRSYKTQTMTSYGTSMMLGGLVGGLVGVIATGLTFKDPVKWDMDIVVHTTEGEDVMINVKYRWQVEHLRHIMCAQPFEKYQASVRVAKAQIRLEEAKAKHRAAQQALRDFETNAKLRRQTKAPGKRSKEELKALIDRHADIFSTLTKRWGMTKEEVVNTMDKHNLWDKDKETIVRTIFMGGSE